MKYTLTDSIRRLVPRTLAAWVLIILVAMLLASQTSLFLILARDRANSNEIVDLYRLNERAFSLAKLLGPLDAASRSKIASEVTDTTAAVSLSSLPAVATPDSADEKLSELEDILYSRLTRFGVQDARVRLDPPATQQNLTPNQGGTAGSDIGDVEADLSEIGRDFLQSDRYIVSLQFADKQWLNFVTPVTPTVPFLSRQSITPYLVISSAVLLLATWAVWRIAAPYRVLEAAVVRLGENLNAPPLSESGGRDIRRAAQALNRTQARLQEYVEERELLAAALAHDLRTPVTRMRLRLALLKNTDLKRSLEGDIAQIEDTVQSVVGLAKLDVSDEPAEQIDLWALVDAIVDEHPVMTFETPRPATSRFICRASPIALSRAISNIVENAVKYGKSGSVHIEPDQQRLHLLIQDRGEGIPEEERHRVFKPFVRLENSRSRQTGGSGLGLTIARSLVRKNGGEITLEGTSGTGLIVRVSLERV